MSDGHQHTSGQHGAGSEQGFHQRARAGAPAGRRHALGDYTANGRLVFISALAVVVGVLSAFVAVALMGLIGLITHLAYYHTWAFQLVSPTGNQLGPWAIPIPIIGGLIVGMMARFGSERIRGHGIPEAMETILVGGSRIEPKLVLLKPTSSAIAIGTGGPFGAEGPIILTGGALGSVLGQFFKLTAAERKTLLVAGAAGGMAATFNAPIASVLLAVELLLFEYKPRSLVPVALASATATIMRRFLIGAQPMFPIGPHPSLSTSGVIAAALVGLVAGLASWVLTLGVYGAEDLFRKLPVHWMWWPALAGVAVGIGGYFFPRALGVGYDTIGGELTGRLAMGVLLGVIVVKSVIWCVALGSGTSGGILAPVLMIGGALGGIEAGALPSHSAGLWALISMAAVLAGMTNSPLTGVIFALETSAALDTLLPLLVACTIAYAVVVLVLRRSILTEKVARRGFHVSREYAVDPLEVLAARDVMRTNIVTLEADLPLTSLTGRLATAHSRSQGLYPVVDTAGELLGVVTRGDVARLDGQAAQPARTVGDLVRPDLVVTYPDETLRMVAAQMILAGVWVLPVVARANPRQIVGLISQREVLKGRERLLEEERQRERVFTLRRLAPRGAAVTAVAEVAEVVQSPARPSDASGVAAPLTRHVTDEVAIEAPETDADGSASGEGSQVVWQRGAIAEGDPGHGPEDV